MYLENFQVQFELKGKPGMFLMLKGKKHSINIVEDVNTTVSTPKNSTANPINNVYSLVVDYPSEPFLTGWEKRGICGALVQMVRLYECTIVLPPSTAVGMCWVHVAY